METIVPFGGVFRPALPPPGRRMDKRRRPCFTGTRAPSPPPRLRCFSRETPPPSPTRRHRLRVRSPPVAHGTRMALEVRRRFETMGVHTIAMAVLMMLLLLLLPTTKTFIGVACLSDPTRYTNQFAVRVAGGDQAGQADRVARKHGFINRGQVSVFRSFLKHFYNHR